MNHWVYEFDNHFDAISTDLLATRCNATRNNFFYHSVAICLLFSFFLLFFSSTERYNSRGSVISDSYARKYDYCWLYFNISWVGSDKLLTRKWTRDFLHHHSSLSKLISRYTRRVAIVKFYFTKNIHRTLSQWLPLRVHPSRIFHNVELINFKNYKDISIKRKEDSCLIYIIYNWRELW